MGWQQPSLFQLTVKNIYRWRHFSYLSKSTTAIYLINLLPYNQPPEILFVEYCNQVLFLFIIFRGLRDPQKGTKTRLQCSGCPGRGTLTLLGPVGVKCGEKVEARWDHRIVTPKEKHIRELGTARPIVYIQSDTICGQISNSVWVQKVSSNYQYVRHKCTIQNWKNQRYWKLC